MEVCIAISNSDDKLGQADWSLFVARVRHEIKHSTGHVHGEWLTSPDSRWQGACWWVALVDSHVPVVQKNLRRAAADFRQDSIAWLAGESEMLRAAT